MEFWYYNHKYKKAIGPFTTSNIEAMIKSNIIDGDTYIWSKHLKEWTLLSKVEQFKDALFTAPPYFKQSNRYLNQSYIGKTCPFCQFPIKNEQKMCLCSNCKIPHHIDCWNENKGCTTFACYGSSMNKNTNSQDRLIVDLDSEEEGIIDDRLKNRGLGTESPRPWVRLFARMTDVFVFSSLFGFIFFMFLFVFSPTLYLSFLEMNDILLGFLVYLVWIFVEALLLSSTGTTLGKWLLGITITDVSGNKIDYQSALSRSFQVWIKGLGLGLPIVSLVTMIISYNKLMKTFYKTDWDLEGGLVVHHEKLSPAKVVLLIVIMLVLAFWISL